MGARQDILKFGCESRCVCAIKGFPKKDRKFVTAKAGGDAGTVTHRCPDPLCDLLENRVTRIVPVYVVDLFEIIEVEQDQREGGAAKASGPEGIGEGLFEPSAVCQAG